MIVKPDGLPYHCSAGGSAVVGDGKSTITYDKDGAKVSYLKSNTTSYVYVPVTNPPSKTAKLVRVQVECDGSNSGTIKEVWVYYSNNKILNTAVSDGAQDFEITAASSEEVADSQPYGINVTMRLSLPYENSYVKIYSVSLGFDGAYVKFYPVNWETGVTIGDVDVDINSETLAKMSLGHQSVGK